MSGCYGEIETQAGDSSLVVMAFYYYYLKQKRCLGNQSVAIYQMNIIKWPAKELIVLLLPWLCQTTGMVAWCKN